MFENQEAERERLLVNIYRLNSGLARVVDQAPLRVVRTVHEQVKREHGVVGALSMSPAGYSAELRRVRLDYAMRSPKSSATPLVANVTEDKDDERFDGAIERMAEQAFPDDEQRRKAFIDAVRRTALINGAPRKEGGK
jgi:hypothetical protein